MKEAAIWRACTPLVRRWQQYFRGRGGQPALAAGKRATIEALEERRLLSGLGFQIIPSTTPGTPAAVSGTASDINQSYTANPVTSGATDPFEVIYSGTLNLSADQAGIYYFKLPSAEGAILTVNGAQAIYAPSIAGDANLDGTVDISDENIVFDNFFTMSGATWGTGDFSGDGAVDISDLNIVEDNQLETVSPTVIDSTGDDNPYGLSTAGVSLHSGANDLKLVYLQYNYNEGSTGYPAAQLLWSTNPTGTYHPISDLSPSPYPSPAGLTASYNGTQFQLDWGGATSASTYNVYESSSSDFYAVPANFLGSTTATSFNVGTPSAGEFFIVTAVNSSGDESPASNEVSINDTSQSYLTGLQAQVDDAGNTVVTGQFSGSVGDWTVHIDNPSGTEIGQASGTSYWLGTGVAVGDNLSAWATDPEGNAWGLVSGTAAMASGTISGTAFNDANFDAVQDSGDTGLPGVTIYLDITGSGTYSAGDPTATTDSAGNYTLNHVLTGLPLTVGFINPAGWAGETPSGRNYVDGSASIGALDPSGSVSGLTFGFGRTLLPPTGLTATAAGSGEADLAWTDWTGGLETGFHVECSIDGGAFSVVDTLGAGANSCSVTGLDMEHHDYQFRVAAYDPNGDSDYSNTANPNAPGATISNMEGVAEASTGTVVLTWTSSENVGFHIYRNDVSGVYATVLASSATEETGGDAWDYSYTDTGVTRGQTYNYTIVPFNPVSGSAIGATSSGAGQNSGDLPIPPSSDGWTNVVFSFGDGVGTAVIGNGYSYVTREMGMGSAPTWNGEAGIWVGGQLIYVGAYVVTDSPNLGTTFDPRTNPFLRDTLDVGGDQPVEAEVLAGACVFETDQLLDAYAELDHSMGIARSVVVANAWSVWMFPPV